MVRPFAAAALLTLAIACFPPALDETGLLCDDTRPCDTGYLCFDGACGRLDGGIDAGPDNWVQNPSFEVLNDAGTQALDWSKAGTGQVFATPDPSTAHSGLRSERLTSPDGGIPQVRTNPPPVTGTLPKQTWCARAYVKSNADDGGVAAQLFVREMDDAGTSVNENTPMKVRAGSTEWIMLSESFLTIGAARLDVRVAFAGKADRGQLLWVDDVQLKRSVDGNCVWP